MRDIGSSITIHEVLITSLPERIHLHKGQVSKTKAHTRATDVANHH